MMKSYWIKKMQTLKQLTRAALIFLKKILKRIVHYFPILGWMLRRLVKSFPELAGAYVKMISPPKRKPAPRRKPVLTVRAAEIFDDLKATTPSPKRKSFLSLRRTRSL